MNLNPDSTEKLLWDAQILANPVLKEKVKWQQRVYDLIRISGRRHLKKELKQLHKERMQNPIYTSFQNRVKELFPNI